ncbi:MAG: hypothetical protein RLZZ308_638 [Candidatus Parcubacteria bacterium]|jgi:hypothetical protein
MKKQLLFASIAMISSCFFVFAQESLIGDADPFESETTAIVEESYPLNNIEDVSSTGDPYTVSNTSFTPSVGINTTIGGVPISIGVGGYSGSGVLGILGLLQKIVERLVPLLIGTAILAFFWFLILFIWKGADNPDTRKKMTGGMMWSIVAIFVMVSVWGIIYFLGNILGISQGGSIDGFRLPGQ